MIVMIKELHEMTGLEFHQIAALRTQVFVVEQNCPYQEVDAIDLIAKHLCIFDEQQQLVFYRRYGSFWSSFSKSSVPWTRAWGSIATRNHQTTKSFLSKCSD